MRIGIFILRNKQVDKLFNIRLLITLLITFLPGIYNVDKMLAQETFSTYGVDDIIEQFTNYDEEEINSAEELKETLYYLMENPLNINEASKEELEQLPFLSSLQVENILFYIYTYGKMQTLHELRLVEDMDIATIQLLTMFVEVGKSDNKTDNQNIRSYFKYGKSEFFTRFSTSMQHKKGYDNVNDSVREKYPGTYYLGSPFYNSVRYSYSYKDKLSIGFTAEKDPGEEFFRKTNRKGYDFYSMHFYLSETKWLKTLAIGNYKANFGKGLVISNNFYMGKNIYAANMVGRNGGIKKHSSTDEVNYLHGIAGTVSVRNIEFSLFQSFRKLDATVDNEFISSFKKDGYHRLQRDIINRKRVDNNLIGSNLKYKGGVFNIELTSVYNILNKTLKPENEIYNIFYPSGRRFFNLGASYDARWKNIFFSGETAVDGNGHIATLNSITLYPTNNMRFTVIHRYYDKKYTSLTASSFASGSRVQNETGVFIGAETSISPSVKFDITFDNYKHPWLTYSSDKPSSGEELSSRLTVSPGYNLSMYIDYKFRRDEYNYTDVDSESYIRERKNNRIRLYCGYSMSQVLSLKTYLDYSIADIKGSGKSKGFAITQNFSFKPKSLPLQISGVYSIFDTDDYTSRIYITTKNLPYTFYFPSLYDKGLYFAGVLRYDFRKYLTLAVRYSVTLFENLEKTGTGPEETYGNKRDDFGISATVRF